MKHKLIFKLAFVITLFTLAACKKDEPSQPDPTPVVANETFSSINSLFASRIEPAQTFTLNAGSGGTITANKGTTITFPASCFQLSNGAAVSGNVTVTVREVFSTSQMIFTGVVPTMNGWPLNSGGEFFVGAKQGNNELLLIPGAMMEISVPAQAEDQGMILFFDDALAADSVNWAPADSVFEWEEQNWSSDFTFDPIGDEYDITVDSMMWMNCDAFINFSGMTCYFHLSGVDGLETSNTVAYAVLDNENAVWPLGVSGWGSTINNLITDTHLGAIPMHVVVISVVNGQLYTGYLPITPTNGLTYEITMAASTADALEDALDALP